MRTTGQLLTFFVERLDEYSGKVARIVDLIVELV